MTKWEALPRGAFNMLTVSDEHGAPVAHVSDRFGQHCNWRLIAAAPELLALAKAVADGKAGLEEERRAEDLIARITNAHDGNPDAVVKGY